MWAFCQMHMVILAAECFVYGISTGRKCLIEFAFIKWLILIVEICASIVFGLSKTDLISYNTIDFGYRVIVSLSLILMVIYLRILHFSLNKCNQLQLYGHSIKISSQLFVIHDENGITFVLSMSGAMKNEENFLKIHIFRFAFWIL